MKAVLYLWAMAFVSCIFAEGSALGADEDEPLKLRVELTDGSVVMGVPATNQLPVKTSYATMAIPMKAVSTIRFSEDRQTATLGFANGDQLAGALGMKALDLQTLFGPVAVDLKLVSAIDVRAGGALPAALLRGLLVRYTFDRDDGTKILDRSGKERHGTAHGTKWLAVGKVGGACEFDGTAAWAEVGCDIPGPDLSFSLWVRIDRDVYGQAILGNYASHDYGGPGFTLIQYGSEARNGPYVQLSAGPRGSAINHKVSIADGKWHHVAGVFDKQVYKLYLDGTKVGSSHGPYGTPPRKPWLGKHHVKTGYAVGRWSTLLDGAIDELMIFGRMLSEEEVLQIYRAQR